MSDKEFDKKMREENKLKQKKETENNIRQVKDKSNKDYWINCYKCGTWCCPFSVKMRHFFRVFHTKVSRNQQ